MAEAPVVEKVARQAKKICDKPWSGNDPSLRQIKLRERTALTRREPRVLLE